MSTSESPPPSPPPSPRPSARATPATPEPLRNLRDFMAANAHYAATQHRASDAVSPTRRAAVLLCMDARLHPSAFLGVAAGDVHMVRNGGGRVTSDAVKSLVASQQVLGTREIYVIHHTDCGLSLFTTPSLLRRAKDSLGWLGAAILASYGRAPTFKAEDVDKALREDVEALAHSRVILASTPIIGLVFDTHSGRLREVVRTMHK
jgi:carbonic anhydrase